MKTRSVWGPAPSRFYRLLRRLERRARNRLSTCVVGCSDGKFVMPLLRRGHNVAAYDIDDVALFGGEKVVPLARRSVPKPPYVSIQQADALPALPYETRAIAGLEQRLRSENLCVLAAVHRTDFYHSPPGTLFDFVFTSCSMQYKNNQDLPVASLIEILQEHVAPGGTLAIEYMLPLEDSHSWKAPHFLRTGQMRSFFRQSRWAMASCREAHRPVFEAAHVDRPQDHYHRFGYLLATRESSDE
jgi:hypothetical protein